MSSIFYTVDIEHFYTVKTPFYYEPEYRKGEPAGMAECATRKEAAEVQEFYEYTLGFVASVQGPFDWSVIDAEAATYYGNRDYEP